jgi:tetratricopeptide (TPR) repeat protein
MSRRDARVLRDEVATAIDRGKFKRAVECILELEQLEPRDASWPKRAAEVYRRIGKTREAIAAYERAVERDAQAGFLVQALAVCKQILQLDPQHSATLRRLAEMAQERTTGPMGVTAMKVSDGVPELTYAPRNTGPIPRVDPETLARVDMLAVDEPHAFELPEETGRIVRGDAIAVAPQAIATPAPTQKPLTSNFTAISYA